ncbi:MAG TPA: putative sulfate/molybdate transporter [Burkholderiales bacterium]|nr:putative sulfate/molybdate transporter [Burkholderiales bacterium]
MEGTERSRALAEAPSSPARNRFDRMEWAGAFGDLGTLVPFIVAYIGVSGLDPLGVLFAFGAALIACGAYYRTPFPVQPMKAIGAVAATQAAQTAVIAPAAIYGAGLVTGIVWLALGLTGAASRVARLVARPVVIGIILGLGMGFMLQGVKMMAGDWLIASIGFAGTVLLLANRTVPAMLLLLAFGASCGAVQHPELVKALAGASIEFHAPDFALGQIGWRDLLIGTAFLALPQVPLTLGNAVIAIREENNALFPDRPVTERGVAISTGLLNIFGASVGGVPMCHGAGGMAGHVAFGARTGGAPIILGSILLLLALFFSGSVQMLFQLLPQAVLGVVLFLTGAQLALGSCDFSKDKGERFVTLITAAFAIWNVGIAFVVGVAGWYVQKRGWLRL